MPANAEFLAFVADQMAGVGPVTVRRMFGGAGIFRDDLMIGLVAGGLLYLRTDGESASQFEARGLAPFVYNKAGRPIIMAYHRAPEECLDDPDEMTVWAGKAYEAARRAQATAIPRRRGARR